MFHNKLVVIFVLVVLSLGLGGLAGRAGSQTAEDARIDAHTRTAVIDEVGRRLIEKYIFLDVAEEVKAHIDARLRKGDYEALDDPVLFASALTEDLYEVSRDRHFYIGFDPRQAELVRAQESESEVEKQRAFEALREKDRVTNFGFKKVENLAGNIGYVDIRYLSNAEYAGQAAVAAMNFLAGADAVIIDIRDTPGGYPNMVQLLCSYFVKGLQEGRTHLNTFQRRFDDSIEQFWTWAYVPGPRMFDTDLYVLTSKHTGSGAEELAYNLRNLKRATLVGESTGGAAHPVRAVVIQKDFVLHLPDGRPINPISGTNWEATGVEPHVAVPAEKALHTAYLMALEKRLQKGGNETQLFQLRWAMDSLRAKLNPIQIDENTLKRYVGTYGERRVWLENGQLFYQRTGPVLKLVPMKEDLFALEGLDHVRMQFEQDDSGKVARIVGLYDNGMRDPAQRTQ